MNPVIACIHSRRTHKHFDGSALSREQLTELVETISWAPNHKLTQPWKAYLLDRPAIEGLATFYATELQGPTIPEKVASKAKDHANGRLQDLGGIIWITCARCDDELQQHEDLMACAAGVQNLLLAAEANGLAAFWNTGRPVRHEATLRWLGIDPAQEIFVACIWLGGKADQPRTPKRHAPDAYSTWINAHAQ